LKNIHICIKLNKANKKVSVANPESFQCVAVGKYDSDIYRGHMKAYGSPASEEVVLERRAYCIRSAVWICTDRLQNLLCLLSQMQLNTT